MLKTKKITLKKHLSYGIALLFIAFIINACAPLKTIMIEEPFIKVYDNLEASQNELFLKANEWMVATFKDAESVIQYSDKEEGTLLGKYLMNGEVRQGLYNVTTDTRIYAKIDIRVKDNKARISIEPMEAWKYDPSGMTIYSYSREDAIAEMEELSSSLHEALKSEKIEF